jgi:hypothetical protein
MRAIWRFCLLVCLLLAVATTQAAPVVPEQVKVPAWNELSDQQQADLSHLAGRWDRLPASRRVLILERYSHWKHLPAQEREALREGARNFRQMSPRQREKMRMSMDAVRALPRAQQRRLRERWRSMTPQQRRLWLDRGGPGIAPPP